MGPASKHACVYIENTHIFHGGKPSRETLSTHGPDVRARVGVIRLDAVVGGVAHPGDSEVGVPGCDDRVEDVEVSAMSAQVEEHIVGGLDPQGVAVAARLAAVELRDQTKQHQRETGRGAGETRAVRARKMHDGHPTVVARVQTSKLLCSLITCVRPARPLLPQNRARASRGRDVTPRVWEQRKTASHTCRVTPWVT